MNATPNAAQQRILDTMTAHAAAHPQGFTVRAVRDLLGLPPTNSAARTVAGGLAVLENSGHLTRTVDGWRVATLDDRYRDAIRTRQEAERMALAAQQHLERVTQDLEDLADEMNLRDRQARQG